MFLTVLLFTLSAAPTPLDQLVAHLAAHHCDEAVLLAPSVSVPEPPTQQGRELARRVAKGAGECRKRDANLGVPLAALAARLAPNDPEVLVEHAEALMGVEDAAAAAAVLDRVVERHPARRAPQAWLLRARLAHRAGDDVLALGLLEPLAADPTWKRRVQPLLVEAQEAVARRGEDPVVMAPKARPAAAPSAEAPAQHSKGEVVMRSHASIGAGGQTSFTVRGLSPGHVYSLRATGGCDRTVRELEDSEGNVHYRRSLSDISGIDFRAQFGKQASRNLPVGTRGAREESRLEFVADAQEMTIRVFDESRLDPDVGCSVGSFSVVAQ